MRSAFVSIFLAALLAGTVGVAQAREAAAGESAATQIVYDSSEPAGVDKWRFFGHVESMEDKCVPDRTVEMFKRKNGKWVFADKGKTNAMGGFKTVAKLPGEPKLKFTVTKEKVGQVTCGSDSIKPFPKSMMRG